MLGLGIMATSQVSAQWQMYLSYGIIAALGMSTAYIPCNMTVVRWFQRQRGLALGIASCGASCGILVVPTLSSYLITLTDWRTSLLILGASMFLLIILAARFMVRDPELLGLETDGKELSTTHEQLGKDEPLHEATGWTLTEARSTFSFWLFLLTFAAILLTTTIPFVHVPVFARDMGLSAIGGSMAVSICGLFALIGSISLGTLSDRIGPKWAVLLSLCVQLVAFLIFLVAKDMVALYLGAAAFGYFYGGIASLFPALVGDLFGRAHAGAIGGFIFGGAGILGAWGPAVVGYLRDVDGDYRRAFILCALMVACSIALFLVLPRPKRDT